jgi:hypothetical protein
MTREEESHFFDRNDGRSILTVLAIFPAPPGEEAA